jgi:putative transposase
LDRMLVFGERQLAHVLIEYENHYNRHRPHRALEQRSPLGAGPTQQSGSVKTLQRTEVVGGLINEYRYAA